jgi:hypothetical protein
MFEDLLKQLIVARPEKPLDFLIQQIKSPQIRRIFFTGQPGSNKQAMSELLADHF